MDEPAAGDDPVFLAYFGGALTWMTAGGGGSVTQAEMEAAIGSPFTFSGYRVTDVGDPTDGTDAINYNTTNRHVTIALSGDVTINADDWRGMTVTFTGALTADVTVTLSARTGLDQDSEFINATSGQYLLKCQATSGSTYIAPGQVKHLTVTSAGQLTGEDMAFFRCVTTISLVRAAAGTYDTLLPKTPPNFRAMPWLGQGTVNLTGTATTNNVRIGTSAGGQGILQVGPAPALGTLTDASRLGLDADSSGLFWYSTAQSPVFRQEVAGGNVATGEILVRCMGEITRSTP